ncbi:MAG: hypothetical protein K1W01_10835 [Muribaculaceae bacterium]
MKNLISIAAFLFIISSLVMACTGRNKAEMATDRQEGIGDTLIIDTPLVVRDSIVVDTVIGHWTIKETADSNDVLVVTKWYTERDWSVFLTLSYDDKVLFTKKEIRTKELMGEEGVYVMCFSDVFWSSDSALYLWFGCFIPDSDIGGTTIYQILPNGDSNVIHLDELMGVDGHDCVAGFLTLYLNERAAHSSAKDLKRLYEKYCTKEIVDGLMSDSIKIVSDSIDFSRAGRTLVADNLTTDYPREIFPFKVRFKSYTKDELPDSSYTDSIYVEVEDATNKICKIDKDYYNKEVE